MRCRPEPDTYATVSPSADRKGAALADAFEAVSADAAASGPESAPAAALADTLAADTEPATEFEASRFDDEEPAARSRPDPRPPTLAPPEVGCHVRALDRGGGKSMAPIPARAEIGVADPGGARAVRRPAVPVPPAPANAAVDGSVDPPSICTCASVVARFAGRCAHMGCCCSCDEGTATLPARDAGSVEFAIGEGFE